MHGDGTQPPRSMPNWVDGGLAGQRHRLPDVPADRDDPPIRRRRRRHASADHVRVQPRDGQLQRLARRLLGRPSRRRPVCRAGSSGSGRTTACGSELPDGSVRLAYGGEFGDTPNDGNFVADGLMSADLEPHPAMREVAWVYRPVTVSLHGGGATRDRCGSPTARSFVGLDDLVASWELLVGRRGGQARSAASARRSIPTTSVTVPLPCAVPARRRRGSPHRPLAFSPRRRWCAPKGTSSRGTRSSCVPPDRPRAAVGLVDAAAASSSGDRRSAGAARRAGAVAGRRPTTTGSS